VFQLNYLFVPQALVETTTVHITGILQHDDALRVSKVLIQKRGIFTAALTTETKSVSPECGMRYYTLMLDDFISISFV
jgi:hypothetical protein